MKLPKELTTFNPFSKYFALSLFIILSFLAFYFGMKYKQMHTSSQSLQNISPLTPTMPIDTNKWVIYQNPMYHYTFKYPFAWKLDAHRAQLTPDPGFPCPTSSVILTSPEGYIFTYDNDQCLGAQPIALIKQENIIVDGVSLVKGYTSANCGSNINDSSDTKLYPKCQTNQFTNISYDTPDQVSTGTMGYTFNHNKRNIFIGVSLPKPVSINDPNFIPIDYVINQIVNSIKFDNI